MKNNKVFKIIFIIFVLIVLFILVDMASKTTPPWERNKTSVQKD